MTGIPGELREAALMDGAGEGASSARSTCRLPAILARPA